MYPGIVSVARSVAGAGANDGSAERKSERREAMHPAAFACPNDLPRATR